MNLIISLKLESFLNNDYFIPYKPFIQKLYKSHNKVSFFLKKRDRRAVIKLKNSIFTYFVNLKLTFSCLNQRGI